MTSAPRKITGCWNTEGLDGREETQNYLATDLSRSSDSDTILLTANRKTRDDSESQEEKKKDIRKQHTSEARSCPAESLCSYLFVAL